MSIDPSDFPSRRPGVPWWLTDDELDELEADFRRREYGEGEDDDEETT